MTALAATGGTGPYTWTVVSGTLPPGVTLPSSGVFTGTPTTAGTFGFRVRVTDSLAATAEADLSIIINPALAVATTALPDATEDAPYTVRLTASGGSGGVTWEIV